jgi:hypothetical protein
LANLFSSSKDGVVPQIETTSMRPKGKKKKFLVIHNRGRVAEREQYHYA